MKHGVFVAIQNHTERAGVIVRDPHMHGTVASIPELSATKSEREAASWLVTARAGTQERRWR